nr:site-specific integrase [Comamonas testosteroni]
MLPMEEEGGYLGHSLTSVLDGETSLVIATAPVPATAAGVFDAWIAHTNKHARFGKESIDPSKSTSYAFIWRSWTKYLSYVLAVPTDSICGSSVLLATPINIAHFIANGPTSSKPSRSISKNTQKRYFTVLQRVYAFCVQQSWLEVSPVDDVAEQDRPDIENHEGHVLTHDQWIACTSRINELTRNDYEFRDRAILMLLFKHGLRPEEVRALSLQDFQTDITNQHILAIHAIRGPEQGRFLPLDAITAESVQSWMAVRSNLKVVKRTCQLLEKTAGNDEIRALCETMFVTEKKMGLSMVTLLTVVRSHIEKSCSSAGVEFPKRMGPQIIRNTRIVRWLTAGLDVQHVVKLAGLKNAKGLLHLRNSCTPEVIDRMQPARRRDDSTHQVNILQR